MQVIFNLRLKRISDIFVLISSDCFVGGTGQPKLEKKQTHTHNKLFPNSKIHSRDTDEHSTHKSQTARRRDNSMFVVTCVVRWYQELIFGNSKFSPKQHQLSLGGFILKFAKVYLELLSSWLFLLCNFSKNVENETMYEYHIVFHVMVVNSREHKTLNLSVHQKIRSLVQFYFKWNMFHSSYAYDKFIIGKHLALAMHTQDIFRRYALRIPFYDAALHFNELYASLGASDSTMTIYIN